MSIIMAKYSIEKKKIFPPLLRDISRLPEWLDCSYLIIFIVYMEPYSISYMKTQHGFMDFCTGGLHQKLPLAYTQKYRENK